MGNPKCQWVRDRLPLLVGEELMGLDRRRVERHLIGCPDCVQHQHGLADAVAVLHAARVESPARTDARSLWPDLARQIRESRRPTAWIWSFSWPALSLRPALGVSLAIGLVAAAGVFVAARSQLADASARILTNTQPIAPTVARAVAVEPPRLAEARPEPSEPPVAENVPASTSRLDYVLDHAVPMGNDGRDGKQPTY
jgi:predicted anti-sigma-YlaC factor YlaD